MAKMVAFEDFGSLKRKKMEDLLSKQKVLHISATNIPATKSEYFHHESFLSFYAYTIL